jgi:hypothetical protein
MSKQSKQSKKLTKGNAAPKTSRAESSPVANEEMSAQDELDAARRSATKRARLLARVAGHVAAGVIQGSSPSTSSAEGVAEISVDIAEHILQKVGI